VAPPLQPWVVEPYLVWGVWFPNHLLLEGADHIQNFGPLLEAHGTRGTGPRQRYTMISRQLISGTEGREMLQPLQVPERKREENAMNYIVGILRTQSGYNSIWVIVDRLSKVAHFILVKTTYTRLQLAELYMSRIVCLHGVPKRIVSDKGTQFTSKFWERLCETTDTCLKFSSAYHPWTNG
jgi:hypothetical protein